MKIWIHINGVQEGPFAPEQLPLNRMDPQTPVWYEGLSYWMPASAAPVTAELLRRYYAGELQQRDSTGYDPTVDVETPTQQETTVDVEAQPSHGQERGTEWQQGRSAAWQQTGQKYAAYPRSSQPGQAPEKCPPTYMVWSIVLTLLCCNPVGIVAAALGWTVTTKYNNYDFDGARRRSELTAWWFIITIVTSLIFTPMYMLISM